MEGQGWGGGKGTDGRRMSDGFHFLFHARRKLFISLEAFSPLYSNAGFFFFSFSEDTPGSFGLTKKVFLPNKMSWLTVFSLCLCQCVE